MRVPLKWLSEYVTGEWTAEFIAERLTLAGVEVGAIERIGQTWNDVCVAFVTEVQPHPNADRLRLVTVDCGTSSSTVVCGAPNVAAGQKVAFARVGAQLIDGHSGKPATLKPATIRGVLSEGMVCSEKELGLSDDHTCTIELPGDAPVGVSLAEYMGDAVLSLELTPNRPDCLSVIGVAREVAALCDGTLRLPDVAIEGQGESVEDMITVSIEDGRDCHRYCATVVRGITPGPSPSWMQERLKASGMRPISNVVDITNYVMLEFGQPLHAFDYDTIAGKEIIVRRARTGEVFRTLDDVERSLSPDVLMITDGERAVGVAGIMGGSNTEVSDTTSTVLLEAANFNRAVIRHGCATLGLRTEASLRFDKGLHPDFAYMAVQRATRLLAEICGGTPAHGVYDAYPAPAEKREILLPAGEVKRLSGIDVAGEDVERILASLGFACTGRDESATSFLVPYWRGDVVGAADLVEDVIRVIGYDRIPVGTPRFTTATVTVPADLWDFKAWLRNLVVGAGFQELLTYSLTSREMLASLWPEGSLPQEPLRIANPMSKEMECLRTSLRGSLLDVLARNRRREHGPVRMFELSRVYIPHGSDLPDEREILCVVMSGTTEEMSWHHSERPMDFYDAKGAVEHVLAKCGIVADFVPGEDSGLFPGRRADIVVDGEKLGVVGQIHPAVARSFEVDAGALVWELDVAKLMAHTSECVGYAPLSRFPYSERDLAIVVDNDVPYERVAEIIEGFGLVARASLFDVYSGEQIPAGMKSFAIRLIFQAPDRTLTDAEVNKVQQKILSRLESALGATLRR